MIYKSQELHYEMREGKYKIKCVQGCFQPEITEFVAGVYYGRKNFKFDLSYNEVLKMMLKDDEAIKDNTITYTAYNDKDEIVATVRKVQSTLDHILPIEKEFEIDLAYIMKKCLPINNVWEIARFASLGAGTNVMKLLLKQGLSDAHIDDLLLASLDVRVLFGLRKLGLPWEDIGQAQNYLGSMTCPVAVSVRDIGGEFSHQRLHLAV